MSVTQFWEESVEDFFKESLEKFLNESLEQFLKETLEIFSLFPGRLFLGISERIFEQTFGRCSKEILCEISEGVRIF